LLPHQIIGFHNAVLDAVDLRVPHITGALSRLAKGELESSCGIEHGDP
jgi:hypothetical protein